MPTRPAGRTSVVLLTFAAISTVAAAWHWSETVSRAHKLAGLLDHLIQVTNERPKLIKMDPDYCDQWTYQTEGGGTAVKAVYTTCNPGETERECEARHDAKVARLQAKCPPITPP